MSKPSKVVLIWVVELARGIGESRPLATGSAEFDDRKAATVAMGLLGKTFADAARFECFIVEKGSGA